MKIKRDTSHDDILIIENQKESTEDKVKRSDSYGKDRMKDFSNYND